LTELAFICIVFAAGMSHFISAKINWQQKVVDNNVLAIKKWLMRAHINIQTHYNAGNIYRGYHYWVGVPLILATVILGSDVIDTTFTQSGLSKVVTGIIGVTPLLLL
jgi:hypothetical protein